MHQIRKNTYETYAWFLLAILLMKFLLYTSRIIKYVSLKMFYFVKAYLIKRYQIII